MAVRGTWRLWVGGALAIVFCLVVAVLNTADPRDEFRLFSTISYFVFVGSGLLASVRRPGNRVGALLVLTGVALAGEDLAFNNAVNSPPGMPDSVPLALFSQPLGQTWVYLLVSMSLGPMVHLALAYPSGRLTTRAARIVVAYAWTATVLNGVDEYLGRAYGHEWDDGSLIGGWSHDLIASGPAVVEPFFLVLGVGVLIRRYVVATAPQRRVYAPFLFAALGLGVLEGIRAALTLLSGQDGAPLAAEFTTLTFCLLPVAMLVGLFRAAGLRVAINELVLELAEDADPRRIAAVLRRTLSDPSVELLTAGPDATWLTESGMVVPAPRPDASQGVTAVGDPRAPRALVVHDPALAEDPELLPAISGAIELAMENDELRGEVQRQLARLSASEADSRYRVGRDLHDGIQQHLVAVLFDLEAARAQLLRGADASEPLGEAAQETRDALAAVRAVVDGLAPPTLVEEGLVAAVQALARRVPIAVDVAVDGLGSGRLDTALETCAYYVASEAVTNAAKHSGAARVALTLHLCDGMLEVIVSDEGGGRADASRPGLRGLSDRVAAFGGTVSIQSPAGAGTTVHARLPL